MSRGMWDLKKLMFAVQGGLCFYCWKPMSQEREHAQAAHYATKDHLVPVSGGGAADWTNTILACTACNRAKDSRMPTERERARHGHLHALFNERVELRRAEIAAQEVKAGLAAAVMVEAELAEGATAILVEAEPPGGASADEHTLLMTATTGAEAVLAFPSAALEESPAALAPERQGHDGVASVEQPLPHSLDERSPDA